MTRRVAPSGELDEASDPTTPPERLQRLARHRDRSVRGAVVSNPNTSFAVLEQLGGTFPDELATNPILGWLQVENPDFLATMSAVVRQRLLMVGAGGLLWWAARFGTDDDKRALLANPGLPVSLVEWLDQNEEGDLHALLRGHICHGESQPSRPELPVAAGSDVEEMLSFSMVPAWLLPAASRAADLDVRKLAAVSRDLPAEDVEALLFDLDPVVRGLAVAHPHAPVEVLELLANLDDVVRPIPELSNQMISRLLAGPDGLARLKARPDLPVSLVDIMASHESWTVRQAIAGSLSITADRAVDLLVDTDRDVRAALAANPESPTWVVEVLRGDDDRMVVDACPTTERCRLDRAVLDRLEVTSERGRILAAAHPKAGRARLVRLATHVEWRVRQACAANVAAPAATLALLALDDDRDVRYAVAVNPSAPASTRQLLASDQDERVRLGVATVATDEASLRMLAGEAESAVMAAAVANPACPDELVGVFLRTGSVLVRSAVAARPALSIDVLLALADIDDDELRLALFRRPDLPDFVATRLFTTHPELAQKARLASHSPDSLPRADIAEIVRVAPWLVPALTEAGSLPAGVIVAFADSTDWRHREQAAQVAGVGDEEVLRSLFNDPDHDVRQAVARNAASPADVVARLATDVSSLVRRAALERPELRVEDVVALVGDDDANVRADALGHIHCPPDLARQQKALDEGRRVRVEVLRVAMSGALPRRVSVAKHPQVTTKQLAVLATDQAWQVREAVASNAQASVDLLVSLADDDDRDVRRAVAAHPRTPEDILHRLFGDPSDMVRKQVLAHPTLGDHNRARAMSALARRSARAGSPLGRASAASSTLVPVADLRRRRLWQSVDFWVRFGVAMNPQTPPAILRRLASDGQTAIREAAKARLLDGHD